MISEMKSLPLFKIISEPLAMAAEILTSRPAN